MNDPFPEWCFHSLRAYGVVKQREALCALSSPRQIVFYARALAKKWTYDATVFFFTIAMILLVVIGLRPSFG